MVITMVALTFGTVGLCICNHENMSNHPAPRFKLRLGVPLNRVTRYFSTCVINELNRSHYKDNTMLPGPFHSSRVCSCIHDRPRLIDIGTGYLNS